MPKYTVRIDSQRALRFLLRLLGPPEKLNAFNYVDGLPDDSSFQTKHAQTWKEIVYLLSRSVKVASAP